ncbi:MAG: hypothetical protein WED34_16060 [Planctomycetales bacterium]
MHAPLLILSLMAFVADDAVPPAVSKPEFHERATAAVRETVPEATVAPVRSKNVHLPDWKIEHPLGERRFYTAVVGQSLVAPIRKFVAVEADGTVRYPFTAAELDEMLARHDKSGWKDEDFVNAAVLRIHFSGVENEDGWKVLRKPDDFLAIRFNMPQAGPAAAARAKAAERIAAPVVSHEDGTTRVTLYAWHLIGGALKKWEIAFDQKVTAKEETLGRFGGGGYD